MQSRGTPWAILLVVAVAACGGSGSGSKDTPDTTPPTVSATSPATSATGVAVDSAIRVTFSEPMSGPTITALTFSLSGGVSGLVTTSGATATLTPSSALAYGTSYTATVTSGVRDAAGNAMASPFTWTFATGPSPSGVLDTSFNGSGLIVTSLGAGDDEANAVAVQTDGKIVVAGQSNGDFGLARYNQDGSLDTTFSGDGKVKTFIVGASSFDQVDALAIQPDGKIVAAGSATNNFAVVRYNTDGSLDTSFDTDGKVTVPSVGGVTSNTNAFAVALQSDGKIVVAGSYTGPGGTSGPQFALARFNLDGSLDTTFDLDGLVITNGVGGATNCIAHALAIQADGKIVAAGSASSSLYTFLVRYNTDGSLDTTFGTGGRVSTSVAYASSWSRGLVIQPDGKIVVAGNVDGNFALYRFNADGSLETIFDQTVGAHDMLRGVALQPDGKLVAVGFLERYINVNGDFILRRYNADGSFDASFGASGRIATSVGNGYFDGGHAVALQLDGRIVVVGAATNGTDNDFVVARYWP